jgi:amino acid transporter
MPEPHAAPPAAQGAAGRGTSTLHPSLGVIGLTIFGIGNMLGAGIYGLVGKTAAVLGNATWMAFAASVLAAGCTGLTYASLGSKYPRAGGAAYITKRAFGLQRLALVVGLAVGMSGLVSMAAGSRIFAGYFIDVVGGVPLWAVVLGYVVALGAVNAIGMRQSTWLNALCTAVEAGGLLLVIAVGVRWWGAVDYLDASSVQNPTGALGPGLVLSGAVLTFYAFIGFEDVLNVSEEVKEPARTVPIAVVVAVSLTTVIYMAVSITAVSVVPHAELAAASGPLALVVERAAPWVPAIILPVIAMFAVANTGLLNYIMGSRLVFGMAREGMLPSLLARLHPTRRTPHVAIILLGVIVALLALSLDLKVLATATSLLLLSSFMVMNAAAIVLRRRPGEPKAGFSVHPAIPALGILVCGTMIAFADRQAMLLAGGLVMAFVVVALAGGKRVAPTEPGPQV